MAISRNRKLKGLTKVTHLVPGRGCIWTQTVWLQSSEVSFTKPRLKRTRTFRWGKGSAGVDKPHLTLNRITKLGAGSNGTAEERGDTQTDRRVQDSADPTLQCTKRCTQIPFRKWWYWRNPVAVSNKNEIISPPTSLNHNTTHRAWWFWVAPKPHEQ